MLFDHLQMPATVGLISDRVGMTAMCGLLRILLCFEFVPPPNLLFFTFVFVLPRPPPFFCGVYELPSSIFFFWVGKFLSDIWSVRITFFVGHFEKKMSDCPTSPTNFDITVLYWWLTRYRYFYSNANIWHLISLHDESFSLMQSARYDKDD